MARAGGDEGLGGEEDHPEGESECGTCHLHLVHVEEGDGLLLRPHMAFRRWRSWRQPWKGQGVYHPEGGLTI